MKKFMQKDLSNAPNIVNRTGHQERFQSLPSAVEGLGMTIANCGIVATKRKENFTTEAQPGRAATKSRNISRKDAKAGDCG
jgi:hypothetical protein